MVATPVADCQTAGMVRNQVRIKALIRFLSAEEGGRSSPLKGGGVYRPNHNFFGPDDRDMCMGSIELADGEEVFPGDALQKEITLLIFPAIEPEIQEGREWRIQEGGKLVAMGTILKVLSPQN